MPYRRAVRRTRRVFRRRRPVYKRVAFRRSFRTRRTPVRRRAFARVQNFVKFTAKSYRDYGLNWSIETPDAGSLTNAVKWKVPLTPQLFFSQNEQFLRNMTEYHWVKFNYIAVKIHELSYMGFQRATNIDNTIIPLGVTSHQAEKYPMYFCWDIEESFGFGSGTAEHVITPTALAQYEGTKKLTPNSKRPVTFVYRFPQPWRQFFATYNVRALEGSKLWHEFMPALSGVQNLRCPSWVLGTHPNWWGASLPDDSTSANIVTQLGVTYYLGVTFRGRTTMGTYPPPVPAPLPEVTEVETED